MTSGPSPDLLHYEDFEVGSVAEFGDRTVTQDEIIAFALKYDPQPMHTDPVAARESVFGGLVASGWHSCAILMRMMCEGWILKGASLGSPGIERCSWLVPVRPGDRLHVRRRIDSRRRSGKRPELGFVLMTAELVKADGTVALELISNGMYRVRDPETAS